jgi:hypothetical protein
MSFSARGLSSTRYIVLPRHLDLPREVIEGPRGLGLQPPSEYFYAICQVLKPFQQRIVLVNA